MKKLLLILTLLAICSSGFSQKEALTWFFGSKVRLNFHAGGNFPAQYFPSSMIARYGSICMSDRNSGTAYFYSDGERVWGMGHVPMPNGTDLYGSALKQQPGIAFEVPGSTTQYYIFTTGNALHPGIFYSVVDMSLNSGIGDIVADKKNIQIPGVDSAQGCIMALKHPNHKSYWVVFRTLGGRNMFKIYLVSEKGVKFHSETECLTSHSLNDYSQSKFSPDGKHFIYTSYNWTTEQERTYEYYSFDPINGNFLDTRYLFKALPDKPEEYDLEHRSNGMEFSADSRFFFTAVMALEEGTPPVLKQFINQFDMNRAEISMDAFEAGLKGVAQSEDTLDLWCQMQLARDGRIYVANSDNKSSRYLSRVIYPYKMGAASTFRSREMMLSASTESTFGLPVIVPSYLNRFDWIGNCSPDSTYFTSFFLPRPDQIRWDFGDGSPVVIGFNPVHKFPGPGTYNVTASAEYPREEYEIVTREVRIVNYPNVGLGPDIAVCPGDSVQLGGVISGDVTWSTGDTTKTILVPAGTYWIRSENYFGCIASDTITITEYTSPLVDNSALKIFPTTCSGATGYIHGIVVNGAGPFTYTWKDASGNVIYSGPNVNMNNVAAGTYSLSVSDIHGCPWSIQNYTVSSVGDDFVDGVEPGPAVCSYPNGSVRVTPDPRFSGLVEYSLNNGPWVTDSLFKDLPPDLYYVRVRIIDNPSCIKSCVAVEVEDYPSPVIDSVSVTHELDSNSDGTLNINIPGANLMYTITGPSGTIGPQSTSLFTGLESGTYTCTVYTILPNGIQCTSDPITAEVPQEYSVMVTGALTAGPPVCVGETITANLKIHNFHGLVHFKTALTFDKTRLSCQSAYLNLNPVLGTVTYNVNNAAGSIDVIWDSPTPLVLPDTVPILTIQFTAINSGIAAVNWNQADVELVSGVNYHILPATPFIPTQLLIYASPVISIVDDEVCDGSAKTITASVNPPGTYNYTWTLPNGSLNNSNSLTINPTTSADEGVYNLMVSDIHTCRDTSDMFLRILPLPDAGFTDTLDYYDVEKLLQATEGYAQYIWNTGESTSAIWINTEGMYTVQITDYNGCVSIDSIKFLSIEKAPFWFYVPTAFTPNGDGINDRFRPSTDYEQIKKFSLKVFDRWGQLIFNSTNAEQGWDGRINGNRISNGIYLWEMIYKKLDDPLVKVTGHVTMIY